MSTIITRNSANSGSTPSSLVQGELAINVTDGRLFYGSGSGNVVKEFTGSASGGATNTGSLLTTASFLDPNLTFTKGNGSTFNVNISSLTVTSASYATTASFITSSGVYGPYGSNSILTASYADTASFSTAASANQILVLNQSGQNIAKGTVVHITASVSSGDTPHIITASYENDNNSANTLGITSQLIANGSTGFVTTEGVVTGINTNAFQSGQLIYLGATGSITGSAPSAPLHSVRLGQVIRHQSNNGSIYVRVDNGYELGELHDVRDLTTSSSYGDLLVKSGSVWTTGRQLTGSYGLTGSLGQGLDVKASGSFSHAEGASTQAIGNASHAEGIGTKTGTPTAYSASVSAGLVTLDASYGDISINFSPGSLLYLYDAPFDAVYSKAIFTISSSTYTTQTEVQLTDVTAATTKAYVGDLSNIGTWSGDQTIPGDYSHSEGIGTQAIGDYSHAEGESTQAIGLSSHAEGASTQAIGSHSHAEGDGTQAIGNFSYAEGIGTLAIGSHSHAEGKGAIAIGNFSHAEGESTQAFGNGSHAEGIQTIASGSAQHVSGKFNTHGNATSLVIIGNGADDNNRSDLALFNTDGIQFNAPLTASIISGSAFTGSLFGTATSASFATTASFLLGSVTSASFASTASYVNGMITKNNAIANTSFTGTPRKATVTFTTAFPNTNYSVVVTGEDLRSWTIESKLAGSFVINTNSNAALTGTTYWQAISYGEFRS